VVGSSCHGRGSFDRLCLAAVVEGSSQNNKMRVHGFVAKKRLRSTRKRNDLFMFQSWAIHSVMVLYELLVRRNALDCRYQYDQNNKRRVQLLQREAVPKLQCNCYASSQKSAVHESEMTFSCSSPWPSVRQGFIRLSRQAKCLG
jgi:hypothetical protein